MAASLTEEELDPGAEPLGQRALDEPREVLEHDAVGRRFESVRARSDL
jgi:hypothetical protein